MPRFIKNRSKAKGLAPGSLVLIGKQKMESPILQVMDYDSSSLNEKEINSIGDIQGEIDTKSVTWLNVYGIHDLDLIKDLGKTFNISPLLLEDILNTDQRPKYESFENFDAIILKMLRYDGDVQKIKAEQITLILGKHYLLTLQEQKGDVFSPVRERIRNNKGRIRLNDNDYLAYALLDTITENYTLVVEIIGQRIEELDDKIFHTKDIGLAEEIYKLKTELNYLRKTIRPVKEVTTSLLRNEDSFFQDKNKIFLSDLNDMITHATEVIELYNNLVSDQLNIYNTNMSNSMNQVMKVLTIFSSIFIPLTFLAGIYGMNFEYIPELGFKYSYPIFWGVVLTIGISLLLYFKRKKWL